MKKINRFFEGTFKKEYFFMEGEIDLDSKSLIEKIQTGIKDPSNKNDITNVNGGMTDWQYFMNDPEIGEIIVNILNEIEQQVALPKYKIHEVWGIEIGFAGSTKQHNHSPCVFSAIIYLNDVEQILYFPQIKKEVKTTRGKFVIFSGDLDHYTHRNLTHTKKYAIVFNSKIIKGF